MERRQTRTFLFTDVEGSSRRWEADPKEMSAALARHDQILVDCVQDCGGEVFKHTGDGICAVFATAPAALDAAIAAQRAVRRADWQAVGGLAVRMAVHTGAAEQRGDDWFGPALNRTARLIGLAHGGQIVVSAAATELAWDDLQPGADLLALGEYPLADLARSERVFQLRHPDLPAAFPPLRCRARPRHNLAGGMSRFVGRQRELAEILALLDDSKLVTLTGVGGTGKTRLAAAAGGAALDRFPDGVFFVELAPISDPAVVVPQIVATLGIMSDRPAADDGGLEDLIRFLAPRRLLLILDNCEHLLDQVAVVVGDLSCRCPDVSHLTTSREPLGLPDETVWRVPSLSLPTGSATAVDELAGSDAVALFCDRARQADPSFVLNAENLPSVVGLCRRLDGLPLALELAAARLRVLSVDQIAERIDDRFRLLSGGVRTALPRHRTLRAAVDWSWDLLSEPERSLLRRLSVFPATFSLTAAEAVCADDASLHQEHVLDTLTALVDKSLVTVDRGRDDARYSLSETLRQYASDRLAEAGETQAIRTRHLEFFQRLARGFRTPLHSDWQGVFSQVDYDNCVAALEWALASSDTLAALRLAGALTWIWASKGRQQEGSMWVERALSVGAEGPARTRGRLLVALAHLTMQRGDLDRAEDVLQQSIGLADQAGDPFGRFEAMSLHGVLCLQRGQVERAHELLEECEAGFRELDEPTARSWCWFNLGWVAIARSDCHGALDAFERARQLYLAGPEASHMPVYMGAALGPVLAALGDHDRAEQHMVPALAATRSMGGVHLVMGLVRAAETWVLGARHDKARLAVVEALELLHEMGGRGWVADTLELAVITLEAAGTPPAVVLRLAGATEAARDELGETGRFRLIHPALKDAEDRATTALGGPVAEQARSEGRTLPADKAVAVALEALHRSAI